MNPLMPPAAQDILDFWFGADDRPRAEWFRKDPAFDATVRERFGPLIEQALRRGIDDWARSPPPALARIVVLDQFTRNVFRDTPASFAGDALALAAAQELVASGQDRRLAPLQRWFVYLPFEHAEDRAAQQESMRLFGLLAAAHAELAGALEWARRHQEVIERFGRFPHRNAILGRASSAEEAAFLREPGSSF